MTRRHQPHVRVVTAFVRIPEPLAEGKVRCNSCSAVVSLSRRGLTLKHKTPAGEPCPYQVRYPQPLDYETPPVNLGPSGSRQAARAAAKVEGCQLDTAALIESGAGGRRAAREACPARYVVMMPVAS